MTKLIFMLIGMVMVGCGRPDPGADRAPADSAGTSPAMVPAHPDSAAVARFRAQIADSVLERRNACPFECCVYGAWVADTVIPVHAAPRADGMPIFNIPKGDTMKAELGVVYVTSIALVVVDDSVQNGPDGAPGLVPGDTLVLLDPIGEGYWTAWRRGEIIKEVPPFFESWWRPKQQGRLIGHPAREWWVRANFKGRTGWFAADRFPVRGADACS
jgi:hypothetical protein